MSGRIARRFTCPLCLSRDVNLVPKTVDTNMRKHFPETYGYGYLICARCLPSALRRINKIV